MTKCQNPECEKEMIKGMNYCSEVCLRQHVEIKKQLKEGILTTELKDEKDIWIGQERRKRATNVILKLANELLPMNYDVFIANLIFRMGLSRRKIEEDYLYTLKNLGFLNNNGDTLYLIKKQELIKTQQVFSKQEKEKSDKEVKEKNV